MIRVRPAAARGHFRNDWLDARFSFSFGNWRDPGMDGWSDLLVLNEDIVAPGGGFSPHPHTDLEVMSWPITGVVEHRDSLGHHALLRPGDVQRLRAGRGLWHSEMNASATAPEHHLQWWIRPATTGLAPSYAQRHVPVASMHNRLQLLASGDGTPGVLDLAQDARVLVTTLDGATVRHVPRPTRRTYVHVATGAVTLNGVALRAGDGACVEREAALDFSAPGGANAQVLLFDLR